jgi:hypothetical protein
LLDGAVKHLVVLLPACHEVMVFVFDKGYLHVESQNPLSHSVGEQSSNATLSPRLLTLFSELSNIVGQSGEPRITLSAAESAKNNCEVVVIEACETAKPDAVIGTRGSTRQNQRT